jgi:uncharacterized protein (DUF58 family)
MASHSAALRRAFAAAAAAVALTLATASSAFAAPGDFTVSGPASFPTAVAVGQSATQTYTVTNHTASPWAFGGIGYPPEVVRIVVELRRRSLRVECQTVTGSVTWCLSGFVAAARVA